MLIGIVVLAAGLVFVGQGLGYIRWPASSFMISEIKWAYYGGGIAVVAELFDRAIRRSSDLYSVVDRELVISIPYIYTQSELRARRKRFWLILAIVVVLLAGVAAAAYLFLPPLDLIIAKAQVGLFR